MILALDSISDRPGAAILEANGGLHLSLDEGPVKEFTAPRLGPAGHLRRLFESSGIAPTRIDGVAFIVGPGSYTGLRSGLAALQGLFFDRAPRAVGIDSFAALSAAASDPTAIAVIRTRRTEWAIRCDAAPRALSAEELRAEIAGRRVIALGALPEGHAAVVFERTLSLVEAAARLGRERIERGESVSLEELRPVCLGSYGDRR